MLHHTRFDGIIVSKRSVILEAFVGEARVFGFAAPQVTPSEIGRPADACITALVQVLAHGRHDDADFGALGSHYAEQRIRLGYDMRSMLVEIGVLRATIMEVLGAEASGHTTVQDADRIAAFFHDVGVEAVVRYVALTRRGYATLHPLTSTLPMAESKR